jgi:phage portal protein BeeE
MVIFTEGISMKIFDVFRKKVDDNSSNTLFGQTALGNVAIYQSGSKRPVAGTQVLYVTTSSSTEAGRQVDMSLLVRNSTIMACIGVKARALAQLPICIKCQTVDGAVVDAVKSDKIGKRDQTKAKSVHRLLNNPNNFQSRYEFWYQWLMWQELSGESFTLW